MRSKIWRLLAGGLLVAAPAVCASLVHGDLRREQDDQDRRRARAVHVPQSARVRARDGAGRERRDAALGRRVGRRGRAHGPGRHARLAEARRSRDHHGQPRPQSDRSPRPHAHAAAAVGRLRLGPAAARRSTEARAWLRMPPRRTSEELLHLFKENWPEGYSSSEEVMLRLYHAALRHTEEMQRFLVPVRSCRPPSS